MFMYCILTPLLYMRCYLVLANTQNKTCSKSGSCAFKICCCSAFLNPHLLQMQNNSRQRNEPAYSINYVPQKFDRQHWYSLHFVETEAIKSLIRHKDHDNVTAFTSHSFFLCMSLQLRVLMFIISWLGGPWQNAVWMSCSVPCHSYLFHCQLL
jgi:hypothetical protein